MSVSDLHIFSKNTDATSSLKGYSYQVLKTIETWLENFSQNSDDVIYCDFEDDIFEKHQLSKTAKFRQIKLYSSNFSFASAEISKCISHFFMLHVKTDYKEWEKEFVFEANTAIARKKGDNDAELLKEWAENQGKLEGELLARCSSKVKAIVEAYVNTQAKALKDKVDDSILNDAMASFKSINDSDWNEFAKRIRWSFNNTPPDKEFASLKERIETLILALPFPIDKKNISLTFGVLHSFVWDKATSKNPDDRKLLPADLKSTLLQTLNQDEKWYWRVFEDWRDAKSIQAFIIGEFYEVIDAVRHCRQHTHLSLHDKQWLNVLKLYLDSEMVTGEFRRKTIYEYLWLRLRPFDPFTMPKGDLFGEGKYFEDYFKDFTELTNASELEDAQNLIAIAQGAYTMGKTDLAETKIEGWSSELQNTLIARIDQETNPNETCHLLENLATTYLFSKEGRKDVSKVMKPLEEIIELIPKADLYNVTNLAERLSQFINLLIRTDPDANSAMVPAIESYSEKLSPFIEKRHGSYKMAKLDIEKGVQYLNSRNPTHLLKALDYFHRAKSKFYHQEYIEGYVLALINIAQVYLAMGMNLAAKYYAFSAAWACIHNGGKHLLKRIADSFSVVFYSDFKQGSWMNAIISFADYMNARGEFKSTKLDPKIDEMPFKIMTDFSLILMATSRLDPNLKVLVDVHIGKLGALADDWIKPMLGDLEKKYPTEASLMALLQRRFTDRPLNDVGQNRTIKFNALGSLWEVSFVNDYDTNSIGEEFCGMLQIMLSEIALSTYDFHLVRSTIKMELHVQNKYAAPEQMPTHKEFKWKVFVEFFDSKEHKEIVMHTAGNSVSLKYILQEISLLPETEFAQGFEQLFRERDLSGKTLVLGAYQRMYRYMFKKERFDSLMRQFFDPIEISVLNLPQTNPVMKWRNTLSSKYDQALAIERIRQRFKNVKRNIDITIDHLKQNPDFPNFINDLRKRGWLDWQIIVAIQNFIINQKANREMSSQTYASEEEQQSAFQDAFFRLRKMDEKDCYVEFPLEAFRSDEFEFQLNHTTIVILQSYGLENNARFPNFSAIKEFLDTRFNVKNDTVNDGNPLADF